MVVGVCRLDLLLYGPQSLKEKRGIIKRILGRCRERFPVSAAETGMQDLWQRAEIGLAMVAVDEPAIQQVFSRVENDITRLGSAEITARDVEILHY